MGGGVRLSRGAVSETATQPAVSYRRAIRATTGDGRKGQRHSKNTGQRRRIVGRKKKSRKSWGRKGVLNSCIRHSATVRKSPGGACLALLDPGMTAESSGTCWRVFGALRDDGAMGVMGWASSWPGNSTVKRRFRVPQQSKAKRRRDLACRAPYEIESASHKRAELQEPSPAFAVIIRPQCISTASRVHRQSHLDCSAYCVSVQLSAAQLQLQAGGDFQVPVNLDASHRQNPVFRVDRTETDRHWALVALARGGARMGGKNV